LYSASYHPCYFLNELFCLLFIFLNNKAGWQWYDRSKLAKPANMDFSKVTRVNYAFFQLNEEGNIWGTDEWGDPRVLFGDVTGDCQPGAPHCRCSWTEPQSKSCSYHLESTGLISLVHSAGRDIYPSIGGWTLSDPYPPMAADAASRRIFARNCRDLIVDYNFDGIDLDWEYPGYAAHSGSPADKENFNLLLRDIREELEGLTAETGRSYGLTAALPCGPSNIQNIDIATVSMFLTEFNLMSYDFHGAWDVNTGVNSPLYDQSNDPEPGWSVNGCVENWVTRGAPRERLNIGLGFYGRSFRDAKGLGVAHGGNDDMSWDIDEGSPQYFNIMDQISSMSIQWDDESETPYAFFTEGGLISYDDERSICLKTEYTNSNDLNGFIIWELSGDVMEDLSTPLLDMLNRKLSEPDTNCADPFGSELAAQLLPMTTAVLPEITTFGSKVEIQLPPMTTTVSSEDTTATSELPITKVEIQLPPMTTTALSEDTTATSELPITKVEIQLPPMTTTVLSENTTPTVELPNMTTEATTTATSSALPPSSSQSTLWASSVSMYSSTLVDGRKPVERLNKTPIRPYRPAKEL